MSETFIITDAEELQRAGERLIAVAAHLQPAVMKALRDGALNARNRAVASVARGKRTGVVYETRATSRGTRYTTPAPSNRRNIGANGKALYRVVRRHQASAPGEPPKTDEGTLVQRILGLDTGPMEVSVGVVDYLPGRFLELGTSRMAARPFLLPAVEREGHNIFKVVQAAIMEPLEQQP
jgi:hypothetical protein